MGPRCRVAVVLATLMGGIQQASAAQLPNLFPVPDLLPLDYPWIGINYPKLFWTPREGFTLGARLSMVRQLSSEDYYNPAPYSATVAIDGQVSTSSSRQLTVQFNAPVWAEGWRFDMILSTLRQARENYFGLGNDSEIDDANVTDSLPHFNRSVNTRLTARGDVQRWIAGNVRLLAGYHAERWRIDSLEGPSLLANDAATNPLIGVNTTDVSWRIGVIYDSRDDEVSPDRGLLLEGIFAVADSSVLGDLSYTRTTVSLAGYLPIGRKTVLAARILGQGMGGSPGIGSLYLIESSGEPYDGIGGESHRGLAENRLLGRHKLLANADIRHHVLNIPRTARLTLVGFVDAGRVFESQSFRITTNGLKVAAGGGLFFQIARAGIGGTTFGVGPDGLRTHFHTSWPF